MKKLLAIILAAVMISACSVTAFAETTNVSYNVDPSYTVSIPAAVTLGDSAVEADITASDVILEGGKQVVVELTSASNTASGSTFNAKNGDSTVTYTITGDEAIAVGDTVATFTADGSKTLTFSAADKSAATVAGAHTETLTFGISVEDAVVVKTLTVGDVTLDYCDGDTWQQIVDRNPDKIKTTSGGGWEVRISKINGSFTSWNLCKGSIGNTNYVYADHVVDPNATYVWWE